MRDNTIILFASDNGGATSGLFADRAQRARKTREEGGVGPGREAAGVQRASCAAARASLYEGGVRVPAFVNWPGKLKPGVVNEPLHMVDVMPTLLALAGGKGSRGSSVRRQGHVGDPRRGSSPPRTRRS